ncbi:hypothetical protein BC938DRAFT_474037 [Jimgerdemannia flammicorona]|uniref:Uncharacterized protein n=1 Tax=Jimgerdemannia flammicorona TaxID=994334 RepID=A0A433QSV5_9FUNG|nr:hypothetical protein BC938DRAFT_474037 [Jimgerdemannia flammicorona]
MESSQILIGVRSLVRCRRSANNHRSASNRQPPKQLTYGVCRACLELTLPNPRDTSENCMGICFLSKITRVMDGVQPDYTESLFGTDIAKSEGYIRERLSADQ